MIPQQQSVPSDNLTWWPYLLLSCSGRHLAFSAMADRAGISPEQHLPKSKALLAQGRMGGWSWGSRCSVGAVSVCLALTSRLCSCAEDVAVLPALLAREAGGPCSALPCHGTAE